MNTRKIVLCSIFAAIFALAFAACKTDPGDPLSGTITITPAGPVIVGTQLIASYTGGTETVIYQWNKDGAAINSENSTTYTPDEVGNYTVTVSAPGYASKTSAVVIVSPDGTPVPGSNLTEKFQWLQTNAQSDTVYTVEVSANEAITPQTISYTAGGVTVVLWGSGRERVIFLSSNGSLFTIESGVTLVLENNITLQGHSNNNASLVRVNSSGVLEMKAGAKISGNTFSASSSYGGGGVYVSSSGTFTMHGGEISGNTTSGSYSYINGGGVYMGGTNATFTMHDGEISGNTTSGSYSSSEGGGVYVGSGTFTMHGGKISGNTSSSSRYSFGGGVNVGSGTFTMHGGKISGNTASGSSDTNFVSGGGVYVEGSNGTFTMHDGEISGNRVSGSNYSEGGGVYVRLGTFTMHGGTISGNTAVRGGGGVHVDSVNYATTFTMHGGKISGNTASYYGGGVVVSGTFTMHGGEISGNTASFGGGVSMYREATFTMHDGEISGNRTNWEGGGVYVAEGSSYHYGTFRIVTGTIYGSNEGDLSNTVPSSRSGAALFREDSNTIAQRGTFSGDTWNSKGDLSTTNNTIKVLNGDIAP